MPNRSSDSVKVFSIDRDAVIEKLTRAVAELARSRPEILRVILFGSLTRENYGPASDADLAVIIQASDKPMRERIPDYLDLAQVIAVDVFPYTEAEFNARRSEGDPFVARILSEGVKIFDRQKT